MKIHNNKWIVTHPAPYPKLRLFCFPYAGGGASVFREWKNRLGPEIEICAVQLPGREQRINETPFKDLEQATQSLCDVLTPHLNMPFAFFGHSLGGLLAFSLCRELRRRSLPSPQCLMVSACRPPHVPEPRPIYHLPNADFANALRRYAGTPAEVLDNKDIMALPLPLLRADFILAEAFQGSEEPPLDVRLAAFCGTEDPDAPESIMSQWKIHTSGDFSQISILGNHFFLHGARDELLQRLNMFLRPALQAA